VTPYQVLPRYLGVSIYRLDANIRHSTVVGIVGAGDIGQVLAASVFCCIHRSISFCGQKWP